LRHSLVRVIVWVMPRRAKLERLPLSIFRMQPGEYVREVTRNGKRYLLTKSGKPAALLVPVDALTGKSDA
jgi:prevent-host-death family protein